MMLLLLLAEATVTNVKLLLLLPIIGILNTRLTKSYIYYSVCYCY